MTPPFSAVCFASFWFSTLISSQLDRSGNWSHAVARFWSRMLLHTAGIRVIVEGLDRLPADLHLVREGGASGDAVAETADEQCVEIGHVVALDDEEILQRQECGPVGAGRGQDEGLPVSYTHLTLPTNREV